MQAEFEQALTWFSAAPTRWVQSAKKDMRAAAEWLWVVLQGDFVEEQSTAQAVTGTVIAMIPLVDQICDIRDVVANSKKINEDTSNRWAWFALVLTLIGLFPTLGSLVKGCFKILFAYGRKGVFSTGRAAMDADLWKATAPFVEAGIGKLNEFLARPGVRKAMAVLHIDNPYAHLAKELRKLAGSLTTGQLIAAFDEALKGLQKLIKLVERWGDAAMQTRTGQLLQTVQNVRQRANAGLADALKPTQDWLNRLAQRLDVEQRLMNRAQTNTVNPHSFQRFSLDAEIEALRKSPPEFVKVAAEGKFMEMSKAPSVPPGHFDISDRAKPPHREVHKTFHDARPDTLPPGTVLYRVLDPKSYDNSICWMTKAEFDKLRNKAEWRDRFAVWRHWNHNGEFTTYTVPPGDGLKVWRGPTASQPLKDNAGNLVKANDKGDGFWLQGGAEQIVVNPADLQRTQLAQRQFTGWGCDEGRIEVNLVGVPILQQYWFEKK
jgi:hypothetical protein